MTTRPLLFLHVPRRDGMVLSRTRSIPPWYIFKQHLDAAQHAARVHFADAAGLDFVVERARLLLPAAFDDAAGFDCVCAWRITYGRRLYTFEAYAGLARA